MFPSYLEKVLACLRERPMTARDIGMRLRITPAAASGRCQFLYAVKAVERTMVKRSWLWSLRP